MADTLTPKDGSGPVDKVTLPGPKGVKGDLEFSVQRGTQLRADGATPTAMREVTINGQQYLAIEYQYNYSASQTTVIEMNGITGSNSPGWHPVGDAQVGHLQSKYGVVVPTPGQ